MIRQYPINIDDVKEEQYYILDIWNDEDINEHKLYTVELNREDGVVWSFRNLIPENGEPPYITIDTSSDIINRTYKLYVPYAATNTVRNRSIIKTPSPERHMGGKKRKTRKTRKRKTIKRSKKTKRKGRTIKRRN